MNARLRRLVFAALLLGVVGSIAGYGVFSAFTATTTNTGNSYAAGTVVISQHTGATTLYTGNDKKPGDSTVACVRITYGGSLTAAVKLYASPAITGGSTFHLKIERGSGLTTLDSSMSCAGFTSSSTPFDADASTFPTTYGTGIDGKASAGTWAATDSVDYRFTISVNDDATANAHTSAVGTGTHSFTWEARNT